MIVPGVTRPLTDLERCQERTQAVNRQSALEEDRQTSANPTLEDT